MNSKMHVNLRLTTLLIGFLPFFAMAEPEGKQTPNGNKLICTVITDRTTITAGSPLLVEMGLENRGKKSVVLDQPLDELYGTAIVQIKRPGGCQFDDIRTPYTGLKQLAGYESFIKPGKHVVAHALLFADSNDALVFGSPGHYELRARMRAGSIQTTSKPVAIDVQAVPPDVEQALNSVHADWTHVSLHEALDAKRLMRIKRALGNSVQFENSLAFIEGMSELNFEVKAAHAKGVQKLERLRTPADPQWKNLATGVLACHCARMGDHEGAKQLLQQSTMRSRLTDQARQILTQSPDEKEALPGSSTTQYSR